LGYSCNDDDTNTDPVTDKRATGWNGNDVPSQVPAFLGTFGEQTNTTVTDKSVDLSAYMPPIKSQGDYGTCVCWAVGYYGKTITEAVGKNLTSKDLQNEQNQLSPGDLWEAIDGPPIKNKDCEGTSIESAMRVLQRRGVLTWQQAPYQSISCNITAKPSSSETLKHKISYYRRIEQTVAAIKNNLKNKIPVAFAAPVSDVFQAYKGGIMANSSYIGPPENGHAMIVIGYDDNKSAFKIANSWGNWGEAGFCWIDYNFFVKQFVSNGNLYIMGDSDKNSPKINSDFGSDLTPWVFSDQSDAKLSGITTQRLLEFNIYNIGSKGASATNGWEFYYIYYNAFDAKDYGILFKDKFNTTVSASSYKCASSVDCSFNYAIPSGSDFASEVFGRNSIKRTYKMPSNLNGSYYLILYADATSKIDEQNEQNNLFYTTGQDPIVFKNGTAARVSNGVEIATSFKFENKQKITPILLKNNEFHSAINNENMNAYSPDEIIGFLKEKKKSGELDKKIMENSGTNPYKNN
jgi:hypothetical protein